MQAASALTAALIAALLNVAASAQELRANNVRIELESAPRHSVRWFHLGCELVEAEFDVDLRTALASTRRLIDAASDPKHNAPPGALQAANALHALCLALLEGTKAVDDARLDLTPPPANAASVLRAYYYLARSRSCCVADADAEELDAAVDARAAISESGDAVLKARAALAMQHVAPAGSGHAPRTTLEEARATIRDAKIGFLEPWLLFYEHLLHRNEGRLIESNAVLDQLEQRAKAEGSRRLLGLALMRRGRFANRERDNDEAVRMYQSARAQMDLLGDRLESAHLIEFEADVEVRRENLERAAELVAQNHALIEGRGLPDCERGILQTRFDLAIKQRDSDLIADLARRLENTSPHDESEWRRYSLVRNRLMRSEGERLTAETNLRAEQERVRERMRLTWMLSAIGVALALAALTTVTLRSRRKLWHANGALREQMQRLAEVQAARNRLEERMRQLERSESLGMMASGIAHDFNNLLVCVLGSAEILAAQEQDPERHALTQAIIAAGQQAARMCKQLRAYHGGAPRNPEAVDLNALLRDVRPVLQAAVEARVTIDATVESSRVLALIDRAEFEQVLLNLVVNARDAGAKSVTVSTTCGHLSADDLARGQVRGDAQPGNYAVLEVADDGEGMSPQLLGRIFDPFFTTRFPGRGLGLAVVYGAVRRHRGGIAVESTVGKGSRFRIYLPHAMLATTQPTLVSAAINAAGPARTVVVVDDEAGVRKLLTLALTAAGHTVFDCADGATAHATLAKLPAEPSPVLLLDLTMPLMDGPEVLRGVRASFPRVPIVLMSGHTSTYLDEMSQDLRPDGLLQKPFDLSVVRQMIATVQRVSARASSTAAESA